MIHDITVRSKLSVKRSKIYHLLMLVEFQWSNGQVASIVTRHASAVLNKVATVIALPLISKMQGTRGYEDRKQSGGIRIYSYVQVHFNEFRYLRVFKFCLEKT